MTLAPEKKTTLSASFLGIRQIIFHNRRYAKKYPLNGVVYFFFWRVTVDAMEFMDFRNYPMDVQTFFFRALSCE